MDINFLPGQATIRTCHGCHASFSSRWIEVLESFNESFHVSPKRWMGMSLCYWLMVAFTPPRVAFSPPPETPWTAAAREDHSRSTVGGPGHHCHFLGGSDFPKRDRFITYNRKKKLTFFLVEAAWRNFLTSKQVTLYEKNMVFDSISKELDTTVVGRNPANQLRLVVYPIIHKVLYIPGGARVLPSTVWHCGSHVLHLLEQGLGIVGWIVPPPPTCLNPNAKAHQNTVASKISGVALLPRHLCNKASRYKCSLVGFSSKSTGPPVWLKVFKDFGVTTNLEIFETKLLKYISCSWPRCKSKTCCWNVVLELWTFGS